MLRRKAEKVIIDTALKGLRSAVESLRCRRERVASSVRVVLFTGKGGVGKTTRAAATAARRPGRGARRWCFRPTRALPRRRSRPSSTGEPTGIENGLYATHIDTHALLDDAWAPCNSVYTVMAERASTAGGRRADRAARRRRPPRAVCGTPGRRVGSWEVVVVDCGPTAETLRLLGLPEAVAGYVERLSPRTGVRSRAAGGSGRGGRGAAAGWDATIDALDGFAEQLGGLRTMLADPRAPRSGSSSCRSGWWRPRRAAR